MKAALAVLAVSLAGCNALGGLAYQGMSPESIHEAVKDKSSGASCARFTGTGGQFEYLSLSNDKGVVVDGEATLKCGSAEATFKNGKAK